MTKKCALWGMSAVLLVAVISILGTLYLIRSEAPDLSNQREWTLIKNDRSAETQRDIRVYFLKHLSSRWDPYTVEQNKIIVSQGEKSLEFMWPRDNEYAGGWCEIARLPDHRAAILLFEGTTSLRIVLFQDSQFVFRSDKDELISTSDIRWQGLTPDGVLQFNIGDAGIVKTLRWTPKVGFAEGTN
jgi:hypothetical protein